jgi:EAL domain-containing protein (putative c-di-GMP-specific phosphodiesterase class I)
MSWAPDVPLRLNVNISARDVREPGLPEAVVEALATSGLPAERLVLEITETGLLAGAPIVDELVALKSLGVKIAIDDFGTGYASLSYLQRFPIDTIKIDRAFVGGESDRDEWALARAIVRIGQALGIETVAEGVETEAQRAALLEIGCTAGQGFLFSPPLPAEAIPEMLGTRPKRRLRSVG